MWLILGRLFIIKLIKFCIPAYHPNSSRKNYISQGSQRILSFWFIRKTCLNLEQDLAGWALRKIKITFRMKYQFLQMKTKKSKLWADHPKEISNWNLKQYQRSIVKLDILQNLAGLWVKWANKNFHQMDHMFTWKAYHSKSKEKHRI